MAYILAKLAVRRSRLERGIATARACGDYDWCRGKSEELELLHKKINALVKCLPGSVVDEAREITNAPI